MLEPTFVGKKRQLEDTGSFVAEQGEEPADGAHNQTPALESEQTSPLLVGNGHNNTPPWLRPFFSLRAQLLFAFSVLLLLVVLTSSLLTYMRPERLYIVLVAAAAVLAGSLLAYIFTTWLLRPLWRVIDASQAIAVGDLAQRERLVLHKPPQDDIDRLAGSLNEMVTRLEKSEELQRASEQRFKRFFSDASHQLRTPLTSIRGFTEILMRGAIDDPKTRQHVLERMKSESERMTNLINDLLTLARLDDGYPLKLQYADLIELATDAINQARKRINDERKIVFELKTEQRLGALVDGERIKQLLFILLDNALKHGRPAPDGLVTLRLDRQGEQAVIRVVDNGEGIDQEDLKYIFDSFYRGRHPHLSNGAKVGTGLGLAVANTIVEAHHGKISVDSEPGKGTEFEVMLPCVE
jgi:two-component system OmpR family sensor kinase